MVYPLVIIFVLPQVDSVLFIVALFSGLARKNTRVTEMSVGILFGYFALGL